MKNRPAAAKELKKKQGDFSNEEWIIVMGASSGGLEALKKIIKSLPGDFTAPIFVVWHMSSEVRGILPQLLNRQNSITTAHAYDKEPITSNRIYIAPPDHHLLIEDGMVRTTRGPKENRFRPAIDPLFRSAAYTHGSRVIGVILSGALDDGTAGLWTVKHHGGISVVQDPMDAEVTSMPKNAIQKVQVDFILPASEIGDLLVRLTQQPAQKAVVVRDEQTKKEIQIAAELSAMNKGELWFGELTPYTCPECNGVLSRIHNDNIIRYRCHTGHAFSSETLMVAISERIEESLYSAIRGIDESIILLNHMGDHFAEINQPKLAAIYFQKAKESAERSQLIRKAVINHEHLHPERLEEEIENSKS